MRYELQLKENEAGKLHLGENIDDETRPQYENTQEFSSTRNTSRWNIRRSASGRSVLREIPRFEQSYSKIEFSEVGGLRCKPKRLKADSSNGANSDSVRKQHAISLQRRILT